MLKITIYLNADDAEDICNRTSNGKAIVFVFLHVS